MKRYHRRWTCSHTSPRRSPTMVTLHDNRFVECRWWNDGWTVKTVVTRPPWYRPLVSVYGEEVRLQVCSAASVSVWRHVQLSTHKSAPTPPPPTPPPSPPTLWLLSGRRYATKKQLRFINQNVSQTKAVALVGTCDTGRGGLARRKLASPVTSRLPFSGASDFLGVLFVWGKL